MTHSSEWPSSYQPSTHTLTFVRTLMSVLERLNPNLNLKLNLNLTPTWNPSVKAQWFEAVRKQTIQFCSVLFIQHLWQLKLQQHIFGSRLPAAMSVTIWLCFLIFVFFKEWAAYEQGVKFFHRTPHWRTFPGFVRGLRSSLNRSSQHFWTAASMAREGCGKQLHLQQIQKLSYSLTEFHNSIRRSLLHEKSAQMGPD